MQIRPECDETSGILSWIDALPSDEVFVRLTGHEETHWEEHRHNRHQIVYVLSGTLHVEVYGTSRFVSDRHVVWIPEGMPHRLSSNSRRISLLVVYFCGGPEAYGDFAVYMTDAFAARNLDFIASCGKIRRTEFPELYGFAVNFFLLLPKVCRKGVFPSLPAVAVSDVRIYPVLDYIKANLGRQLSLASVAEATGFSVRNLTRLFTGAGIRFVRYVNYHRIVKAVEILVDGTMNIEQTAYEVGFSSPNTFSRVFRSITGSSPSEYLGRR